MFRSLLVLAVLVSACLAGSPAAVVTCGSLVKLQHIDSGCRLHSHNIPYGFGRGSGQQSVTCYPNSNSAESYWLVTCGEDLKSQSTITSGQVLRLKHSSSKAWLHSHQFMSPLSGNQEVSCFGSDTESDEGDLWRVEWDTGKHGKQWRQDFPVSLQHVTTKQFLASQNQAFSQPIQGHTEVYATKKNSKQAKWAAAEGVYLPVREA